MGYISNNNFFNLAGGFLVLLSGILFLTAPLSVQDGFLINETSDTTYSVSTTYSQPPSLLNHAFNLIIILVGMMFMWDSYIKLQDEKYANYEK